MYGYNVGEVLTGALYDECQIDVRDNLSGVLCKTWERGLVSVMPLMLNGNSSFIVREYDMS